MKHFIQSLLIGTCILSACSPRPEKVEPFYISPDVHYRDSCDDLAAEHARISSKVQNLYSKQNNEAIKDMAAVGVAYVLYLPAALMMIGKDKQDELSFVKGEYNALEAAAIQKECPIAQVIADERAAQKALEEQRFAKFKELKAFLNKNAQRTAPVDEEKINSTINLKNNTIITTTITPPVLDLDQEINKINNQLNQQPLVENIPAPLTTKEAEIGETIEEIVKTGDMSIPQNSANTAVVAPDNTPISLLPPL